MTDSEVEAVARALTNRERVARGCKPLPNPWRKYNRLVFVEEAKTAIAALDKIRAA